jgi:hypothetical protein
MVNWSTRCTAVRSTLLATVAAAGLAAGLVAVPAVSASAADDPSVERCDDLDLTHANTELAGGLYFCAALVGGEINYRFAVLNLGHRAEDGTTISNTEPASLSSSITFRNSDGTVLLTESLSASTTDDSMSGDGHLAIPGDTQPGNYTLVLEATTVTANVSTDSQNSQFAVPDPITIPFQIGREVPTVISGDGVENCASEGFSTDMPSDDGGLRSGEIEFCASRVEGTINYRVVVTGLSTMDYRSLHGFAAPARLSGTVTLDSVDGHRMWTNGVVASGHDEILTVDGTGVVLADHSHQGPFLLALHAELIPNFWTHDGRIAFPDLALHIDPGVAR